MNARLLALTGSLTLGAALLVPITPATAAIDFTGTRSTARTISADFTHAAFLDANGGVWASGGQEHGALGDGVITSTSIDDPIAIPLPSGVVATKVDVGGGCTVILGNNGVLYGTGANGQGQLTGVGDKSAMAAFTWAPSVPTPPTIVDFSTSDSAGTSATTTVVGSDGKLYFAGTRITGDAVVNELTLFGYALPGDAGTPVQVIAGYEDILVITDTGRLYGIGTNPSDRLTGSWTNATTWVRLDSTGGVVAAVAGYSHTAWLTSVGTLYSVGSDSSGQLGNGDPKTASATPVTAAGTWTAIAGDAFDSTMALKADGTAHVTGLQPDFSTATSFTPVPGGAGLAIGEIASGANTLLMRTTDGRVFGVGAQNFSQLGSPTNLAPSWRPQDDQPTVSTASIAPAGSPKVGQELTSGTGVWVPEPETTTYEWRLGTGLDTVIAATTSTFTPLPAYAGKALRLVVNVSGAPLIANSVFVDLGTIAPGTLTGGAPAIAGTSGVAKVLTASAPATVPATPPTWQWYRDNVAIPGASAATYTQTILDGGRSLTVRATWTTPGYDTLTTGSTARRVPAFSKTRPVISGIAKKGRRLKAGKGTWAAYQHTYSVRWYRNGVPITGATKFSYLVTTRDKGKVLTVRVTAKRAGWPSVVAKSLGRRVAR